MYKYNLLQGFKIQYTFSKKRLLKSADKHKVVSSTPSIFAILTYFLKMWKADMKNFNCA